jgi:hypothetical protein
MSNLESDRLSTLARVSVDRACLGLGVSGLVKAALVVCIYAETYCPEFFGIPMPRGIYADALAAYQSALAP